MTALRDLVFEGERALAPIGEVDRVDRADRLHAFDGVTMSVALKQDRGGHDLGNRVDDAVRRRGCSRAAPRAAESSHTRCFEDSSREAY